MIYSGGGPPVLSVSNSDHEPNHNSIHQSLLFISADGASKDDDDAMDLASVSSTSTSSLGSFNKMIQDFKKALSERKTPKNLNYLNKIIIVILLASLILSCLEFNF